MTTTFCCGTGSRLPEDQAAGSIQTLAAPWRGCGGIAPLLEALASLLRRGLADLTTQPAGILTDVQTYFIGLIMLMFSTNDESHDAGYI
jgi:hypothetical protein